MERPAPACAATTNRTDRNGKEVKRMAGWLWILIVLFIVLALYGGAGYSRW